MAIGRDMRHDIDLKVLDWLALHPDPTQAQLVHAAVEIAEPLIRADEREQKFHDMDGLGMDLLRARKRLADLRAKVEALPVVLVDEYYYTPAVRLPDVLALFGGDSDD